MALADIRTRIKTVLEGVAAIGVVTDWEPLTTRREDFLTYFKASALAYMQGWTITREQTTERVRNQSRANDRTHLMVIRGYRAIDNATASEKSFQALLEAVCDALRAEENGQLDGTADLVGPPVVRITEPREFSGYLVHYAEIAFPATEAKTF